MVSPGFSTTGGRASRHLFVVALVALLVSGTGVLGLFSDRRAAAPASEAVVGAPSGEDESTEAIDLFPLLTFAFDAASGSAGIPPLPAPSMANLPDAEIPCGRRVTDLIPHPPRATA